MNICDLNKFIDLAGEIKINAYRFDPVNEEATMSKGKESVVVDLNLSNDDQLSLFQSFLDGFSNGN